MSKRTMTEGTPWKHIISFALPVLAGSLLQQLYNTADSVIVGRNAGQSALSGVGTTGTFTFLFLAIAIGFSSGNSVVIAQHYGAGNEKAVRRTASTGIIFLLGLGLVSTLIGIAISEPVLTHFVGVQPEYHDYAVQYFRWYCLGLIFQFGYNIFSSILRAVGDSKATLYFLLISSVINIVLDLLFVGVFKWGVFGAAIATDIAQAGSFIAAYIYMIKKYPIFRFKLKEYVWDYQAAQRTIIVGTPIALQLVIVSFGLTLIQRAVNDFGEDMTASFTVGSRIEMYLNLPCNALQTTLATYTGQNFGAGKPERVKQGARQTIFISVGLTLLISGIIILTAQNIVDLFALNKAASDYCIQHLRTIALVNVVLSFYIPLFGVFQGTNHSLVPTIVATCALTVRVIVTYLFRYSDFFGYSIIWWNGLFGFGTGCTITWTNYLNGWWLRGSKKRIEKIPEKE
jgi:putative MATE family efflux protein